MKRPLILLLIALAVAAAAFLPAQYADYKERKEARELYDCSQVRGTHSDIYLCLVNRYGWDAKHAEVEALMAYAKRYR